MDAGAARGIEAGDEFALFSKPRNSSQTSSPLAIFIVIEAHPYHSIMKPHSSGSRFQFCEPSFAMQTAYGRNLPIYAAERNELEPVFEALIQKQNLRPDRPGILRVAKEEAILTIDLDYKKVVFGMSALDEHVAEFFNSQRIPFSVELDMDKLRPVVDAAAHFHCQFCRTDKYHNLQRWIRFEFTEVRQVERMDIEDTRTVIESVGDNLVHDGVINLVSGPQGYGIKILNNSRIPLYAALFYFDTSNLSISMLSFAYTDRGIDIQSFSATQPLIFR